MRGGFSSLGCRREGVGFVGLRIQDGLDASLGVWVKVGTCEALVGLEGLCHLGNSGGAKEEHRIAGRHVLMCVPERHLKMEKE